jgi:hypothetical protein
MNVSLYQVIFDGVELEDVVLVFRED